MAHDAALGNAVDPSVPQRRGLPDARRQGTHDRRSRLVACGRSPTFSQPVRRAERGGSSGTHRVRRIPLMSHDRRAFVRTATSAIAVALLPSCASLVTRRVPLENGRIRLSLRQHPELAEPRGSLRLLPDGWEDPVYLLVLEGGGFAAVSSVCTHRGCTVDLGGPGLACPC